jgi:hypothetical protein
MQSSGERREIREGRGGSLTINLKFFRRPCERTRASTLREH